MRRSGAGAEPPCEGAEIFGVGFEILGKRSESLLPVVWRRAAAAIFGREPHLPVVLELDAKHLRHLAMGAERRRQKVRDFFEIHGLRIQTVDMPDN